ncbi:HlyD family secretion protein [Rosistilla carotiformis]|uniref:HlyD family secretion protein n=1 Tax=Rosistilla carotiformis TaxID=2528017 RepID=A0A518K1G1_9BACT|nr:biotin/lipoyl-binding protein [Rosistilla carotiformis]QDV71641.1 HlyD family secretion protein [Rosistilla carotiformis]
MSAETPTQSDLRADLPRLLRAIAAAPAQPADPLASLAQRLPELCNASGASAGILWSPDGGGFRWQASHGIELADAAPDSDFTADIVANAEQVCETGRADIFVTPESSQAFDHPDAVDDDAIRELVLFHRQLVFPIRRDKQTLAVAELFQPNALPESSHWTLADLQQVQAELERSIAPTHRDTEPSPRIPDATAPLAVIAAKAIQGNHSTDEPSSPDDETDQEIVSEHRAATADIAAVSKNVAVPVTDIQVDPIATPLPPVQPAGLKSHAASPEPNQTEHAIVEVATPAPITSVVQSPELQARAMRVAEVVGRNLHETEVAFDVVNELHAFFGEGRISLAIFRGQSCVVRAISNQQVFDRRSESVIAIQRLATRSATARLAIWSPEQASDMAPELTRLLDIYYEATDAQSVAFVPLIQKREPSNDPNDLAAIVRDRDANLGDVVGVLAIEGLQRPLCRDEILPMWQAIELPVVNAVANARRHNSLFLMPVWKELGHFTNLFRGHHRNKAIGITLLLAAIIAALSLVPADFKLRCEGIVQPTQRSKVYAQTEGVVDQLLVSDGQWVQQGQVLLTLSNPALSAEIADVEGKLRETRQKLKTCRLQRLLGDFKDDEQRQTNVRQCAGFEASLGKIQDQYDLLLEKQAQLQITSPADGQIVTWDMPQRLTARPVQPGQKLLTIADPKGPWELELKLADKRSGYLRDVIDKQPPPHGDTNDQAPDDASGLKTSYVLASHPTLVREGTIREIARSADVDEDQGNIIRVYVDIGKQPTDSEIRTRPGTEVIAHIHAGRGSIGYCKLYEFFDWAKRTWFKYV